MNSAKEIPYLSLGGDDASEFDIHEYIAIANAQKYRSLVFAMALSALAAVVVYSMSPVYQSTATLLIESDDANVVSIEQVYGIDSSRNEYYKTQFEILSSREISERVIAELNVTDHPEYAVDIDKDKNSGLRQYLWFLPPAREPTEEQLHQGIVGQFQGRLSIDPRRATQLVDIGFESQDPVFAAEVANAIGNAYINAGLEARVELSQNAASWLTERLSGLTDELARAEDEFREFQERENLVDVSGVQTLTARELDEQTRRLVDARKITSAARQQLTAAGDVDGSYQPAWESLAGVLQDQLAQNLKVEEAAARNNFEEATKRYGPLHPRYVAAETQMASTRGAFQSRVLKVVKGFEDTYQQALANQKAVEDSLEESKQEVQQINRKSYELSQLERTVATNKQLHDTFFRRFQETNRADFSIPSARFIDHAKRSYAPVKPQKALIISGVFVVGFLVGILLAILRYTLDRTIRVAAQVEDKLGQPALGVIPFEQMGTKDPTFGPQLYLSKPNSGFSESVRSLRTSVILSGLEKKQKVIVITSSLVGEGKTTIAANLALALGQMHRVLLVDADMRRPSQAVGFGLNRSVNGLSELVAGTEKAEDCIITLEDQGIDFIPSGSVPPNPLDLLSSRRFKELLASLSSQYDKVILDSAPLQAVSDSLILSTLADSLLYVVKADATTSDIARNGLQRLLRASSPVDGVVLNQFDVRSAIRYGAARYGYARYGYSNYGYGYGYGYGHGYTSSS